MKFKIIFSLLTGLSLSAIAQVNLQEADSLNISKYRIIETDKSTAFSLVEEGQIKIRKVIDAQHYVVEFINQTQQNSRILFGQSQIAEPNWKLSSSLNNPLNKRVPLALILKSDQLEGLKSRLKESQIGYQTIKEIAQYGIIVIKLQDTDDLNKILIFDELIFADRYIDAPKEESINSLNDLSVNKINKAQGQYPEVDGSGLTISVKERAFDTADIDIRGRFELTELTDKIVSPHASQMATIIGGAGNTASTSLGVAKAVRFTSSSYENFFPDEISFFNDLDISVQNHSYGTEIQNYYGAEAEAYDEFLNQNSTVLHVFSSGNSGDALAEDGPYANLPNFANITGNMKMAKNVLIVGAHNKLGETDSRNSNGPAHDGRIKPELVAFGPEGSSDAAALVSGVALLLQEAYKNQTEILPDAALLKAILVAATDDIGVSGPDHARGFGALNAYKSLEIINRKQFIESQIGSNTRLDFPINISEPIAQIQISLAWNDQAANAGDNLLLRNNLDLELVDPNGQIILPWTLSTYAHADSLNKIAVRGKDELNNVEFISLQNPVSGNYILRIKSSTLINAQQKFFMAYKVDSLASFEWTFPLKNDALEASTEKVVRWESTYSGTAFLDLVSEDGTWQNISYQVDLLSGRFQINLQNEIGKFQLRMRVNSTHLLTDTFSISPIFSNSVGYNCTDEFMLTWPKWSEATQYQVYALGNKYLELIAETIDTSRVFAKAEYPQSHFMVRPMLQNVPANRSYAYDYANQGIFCYYSSFYATKENNALKINLKLSTLSNVQRVIFGKISTFTFQPMQDLPIENGQLTYSVIDSMPKYGLNSYRATIVLSTGEQIQTEIFEINFSDESTYIVYPNPALNSESVSVLTDAKDLQFQLLNGQGKLILVEDISTSLQTIPLNSISPGLYFYRIFRAGKNASSGKLIILN